MSDETERENLAEAEAERRVRAHVDAMERAGQRGLMLDVVMAEYDRRGKIEKAATQMICAAFPQVRLDGEQRLRNLLAEYGAWL